MKKRSVFVTVAQIIITLVGLVGLVYLVALYIPASKVFFTDDANLGDVIATVLAFIPLSLMIGPVVAIFGIIDLVMAVKQRNNPESKDVLSFVFMVFGIILIVLPAAMISSMFMASAASDSSSAIVAII